MSRNTRIMIYCLIMSMVAGLASLAIFSMMGYQFIVFPSPKIISPVTTGNVEPLPTEVVYDYSGIAEEYFSDDKDLDLCLSLFEELDTYSYNKHLLNWNESTNPTIINISIYPEVSVSNPEGRVIFTEYEVTVQKWIPTENGRRTINVDQADQDYNQMLSSALTKTEGNRGYMASWIITLIDNNPNHYSASGSCSPIPYK